MKIFTTIYIWLFTPLLYFIAFIIIFIINPFVKNDTILKFIRFASKIILKIIFVRCTIIYEEEIDKSGTYIFMPNHTSLIDVLVATAYFPQSMNAIEAKSHFKWPIYGKIIKIIGQIPIDRKKARESIKSFEIAKEKLKKGRSIIVFPEGTRTKDGYLGKFKNLPFKFAKEANYPVVPVTIIGVIPMSPEHQFWIKPAKVKIIFGKHLNPEQISNIETNDLKNQIRNEIILMAEKYK